MRQNVPRKRLVEQYARLDRNTFNVVCDRIRRIGDHRRSVDLLCPSDRSLTPDAYCCAGDYAGERGTGSGPADLHRPRRPAFSDAEIPDYCARPRTHEAGVGREADADWLLPSIHPYRGPAATD